MSDVIPDDNKDESLVTTSVATLLSSAEVIYDDDDEEEGMANPKKKKHIFEGKLTRWSTDGQIYIPTTKTIATLPPACYEICPSDQGLYFKTVPVKNASLIRFPDNNSDKVINEIQNFWKKKDIFKHYGLSFKRGIILYGPAGSGKSSTIHFIMKDVIDLGGIVIFFNVPSIFVQGIRLLRQIQPDTQL